MQHARRDGISFATAVKALCRLQAVRAELIDERLEVETRCSAEDGSAECPLQNY